MKLAPRSLVAPGKQGPADFLRLDMAQNLRGHLASIRSLALATVVKFLAIVIENRRFSISLLYRVFF